MFRTRLMYIHILVCKFVFRLHETEWLDRLWSLKFRAHSVVC